MHDRDILIDVSRLVWRFWRGGLPTGIDRVCLAYVKHFASRAQAVIQRSGHFFVLTPRHSDRLFDLFLGDEPLFRRQFLWFALRAFRAARANPRTHSQVYLNVGHTGLHERSLTAWISRNAIRAVFLVHDLIPLRHPEFCRPGEKERHQARMENALTSAHGLIGNSQATIDDLASFAAANKLPMAPSVAAFIAGPPVPSNVTAASLDRPYFVVVGTIEGRKNHGLLLRVWKELAKDYGSDTPLLLIVGQRGWKAEDAIAVLDRDLVLRDHVLELGKCNDAEMAALIAGARALLMPSFAEGFGLPIAEALELGTPAIASDLPVFREFAGDIPTYLDPRDDRGWKETVIAFTGETIDRERQRKAMSGYRAPDWRNHFEVVERWLRTLP